MKKKILIVCFASLIIVGIMLFSYFSGFRLKGNKQIYLAYGEKYKDPGIEAKFLFFSLKSKVKITSNVNEKKMGNYKVTYKLPFKTLTRTITIKDKTAPVIVLKGDEEMTLSLGSNYEESGYEATDNIDKNLTEKVKVKNNIDSNKLGDYEVIYEVEDSSKNKVKKIRKVTVKDDVPPIITLKGSKIIYKKVGESYKDEGYEAKDNHDGDITDKVKIINNVNYNQVGTYEIIYEVEDTFKNKSTEKRIIKIAEREETKVDITYIKGILLVNKKYHLPADYNPGVNSEAWSALTALQNAAKEAGYDMPMLSGFRSYDTQKWLFQSYVDRDGVEKANTYSARPGQSEHQTGLAFDVGSITNSYGDTDAGKWLAANCHKYGFILRYLKGKESITGYQYEPWHIRYINVGVATEIYNRGITLEEYLGAL